MANAVAADEAEATGPDRTSAPVAEARGIGGRAGPVVAQDPDAAH